MMKKWCAASSGPKSLPILAFCGAFEGSNQNSPDDVDAMQGERSSQSRMIFER